LSPERSGAKHHGLSLQGRHEYNSPEPYVNGAIYDVRTTDSHPRSGPLARVLVIRLRVEYSAPTGRVVHPTTVFLHVALTSPFPLICKGAIKAFIAVGDIYGRAAHP